MRDLAAAIEAFDVRLNDFGLYAPSGHRPPAWHLLGTCRMGADPEASVTDAWHGAWDYPNLHVVDGSSLPTGDAVNPTSTISALALRAAACSLRERHRYPRAMPCYKVIKEIA